MLQQKDRVRVLAGGYQIHLSKPVEPAEFVLVDFWSQPLWAEDRVANRVTGPPSQQTAAGLDPIGDVWLRA